MENLNGNDLKILDELIEKAGINVRDFKRYRFNDLKKMRNLFIAIFKKVDKTFSEYKHLPEYEEVIEWLNDNKGKGLLLTGNVGRGKSVILNGIIPVIFNGVHKKILKPLSARNLDDVKKNKLWAYCIDDIGTDEIINDYGSKIDPVEFLISDAEDHAKLLIMSSNLTRDMIKERYGLRTLDRINRLCKVIPFTGKSMRKL